MRALIVTADGEMRCMEVKDPVPLVLRIKKQEWVPKAWKDYLPQEYETGVCSLLAPTDEKMTVAVYEEDGAPEDVDEIM